MNKGTKLKEIKLEDLKFTANGNEYFIEPHISVERFAKMQELEIELGFGIDYQKMFNTLMKLKDLMNNMKFVDASVLVHNLASGIAQLEERRYPILEYCACFINRKDEDRRVFDEKVIKEKIDDWVEEGIEMNSFFKLAVNMVNGLKENYLEYIQSISEKEKV